MADPPKLSPQQSSPQPAKRTAQSRPTRALTRNQTLENTAFLRVLRRTGNVRLAARTVRANYSTLQHRRKMHPAFAARWAIAIVVAEARLNEAGLSGPERGADMIDGGSEGRASGGPIDGAAGEATGGAGGDPATASPSGQRTAHRTRGGETVVVRRNDGKFQIRAAQPGKVTRACEQAFLLALSATANVRLSAAAAGAAPGAFYRRRRKNPAFAREMRLALEHGYEAVEMALIESFNPASYADDAWRHNDPPPMPRMTADQGLKLLYLHQKEVRLQAEPGHIKRRRGETSEAHSYRLAAMYRAKQAQDAEAGEVALAAQAEGWGVSRHEPPPPVLPSLDQVELARRGRGR